MWKESEMSNAWGRRIARDMPQMSRFLRYGFYIGEFMVSTKYLVSLLLIAISFYLMLSVLSESYLGFGDTMLTVNPKTPLVFWSVGLLPAYWLAILVVNSSVRYWYTKVKKSWVKG
jgi:hypothetical protein